MRLIDAPNTRKCNYIAITIHSGTRDQLPMLTVIKSNLKVERETPIVHQNIKNNRNDTQTTHSIDNLRVKTKNP